MDDTCFGGLVERGNEETLRFGGVFLFAGEQGLGVAGFQSAQARFDALVLRILAGADSRRSLG